MEALVENSSNPPCRFYCHSCSVEIDRVSSNFTCPHCSEGFIEELPAADRSNNPATPPPQLPPQAGSDGDSNPNDFINPQAIRLASEIFSSSILSPLLLSTSSGPRGSDSDGAGSMGDDGAEPGAMGASNGGGVGGGGGPTLMRGLGRHRNRRRGNLDDILREILISVADGANGGVGGTPMFFMGNPGDYAWGREGLDTIVTQLLNQMDNTGPPPLEKEKIAEIPKVTISAEQVDMKLQCSVCWEDFQIDESVRKLSCGHVYHESCIIPWLELHGTCPICRKSLAPEQPDEQRGLAAAASAVANTLRSLHSDAFPGATSHSSSSSVDEGGPSTSSLLVDLGTPMFSFSTTGSAASLGNPRPHHRCPNTTRESNASTASIATPTSTSNNGSATTTGAASTSEPGTDSSRSGNSGTNRYRDDDGNIDYDFD